ncbi:MAG: ATP-binding protein [Bacteroidota bacterium]|nr:ATP-binding protein [Bacteroidota bacterium]
MSGIFECCIRCENITKAVLIIIILLCLFGYVNCPANNNDLNLFTDYRIYFILIGILSIITFIHTLLKNRIITNTDQLNGTDFQETNNTDSITDKDISDYKKILEDMEIAKKEAEISNKLNIDFIANMSHEIRTPVNSIVSFSDLLYSTVKEEKLRTQINIIRSNSRNLLNMINDILDLSKIEAGKMKIQLESVNLLSIIKDVENIFIHEINEKKISFFINIDNELPELLKLDDLRIRQILFNLLGNAIKFTETGGIKLSVNFNKRDNKLIDLKISVKDTGIGIPRDQLKIIFESFNQQKYQSAKKYGGTGLGLAITKRLVEMMNGKISVESEPGVGSEFEVLIPGIEILKDIQLRLNYSESNMNFGEFVNNAVMISEGKEINLPEIINKLEKDYLVRSEIVIRNQNIDEIEKFGKDLIQFGQENSIRIIEEYGHSICYFVNTFEIDKLMSKLNKFPGVIDNIKSLQEK